MRGRQWNFRVVPGALVVIMAYVESQFAHPNDFAGTPCSECWLEAGHVVRYCLDRARTRWRKENAR